MDPKAAIEKVCHSACSQPWSSTQKCKERIAAKGAGSCEPWAFEYWKCMDKCVDGYVCVDIIT